MIQVHFKTILKSVGRKWHTCIGMSESNARYQVKKIEEKYKLTYTLEVDLEKLGYMQFILLVKFQTNAPPLNEIKKALEMEPAVQFAIASNGDYDIVAYLLEEDTYSAERMLWRLKRETLLSGYDAEWYFTPFYSFYGMVMFKDAFFEKVLSSKLKSKKDEEFSVRKISLNYREYSVLRSMNRNSKVEFSEIDRECKLNQGSAQYTYHKLKENGLIIRPTIHTNLPAKYIAVILLDFVNIKKFDRTRSAMRLDIIKNGSVANKYALTGDMQAPVSGVLCMPVFENSDFSDTMDHLKSSLDGVKIRAIIGTDILTGSLCYRRFDNVHSKHYEYLVGEEVIKQEEKQEYE